MTCVGATSVATTVVQCHVATDVAPTGHWPVPVGPSPMAVSRTGSGLGTGARPATGPADRRHPLGPDPLAVFQATWPSRPRLPRSVRRGFRTAGRRRPCKWYRPRRRMRCPRSCRPRVSEISRRGHRTADCAPRSCGWLRCRAGSRWGWRRAGEWCRGTGRSGRSQPYVHTRR